LKHFPHLLQRVPLKYLATYLGINLETLSRIRAKANKKA
jgi:CRP/FNR family transcriptional regulator, anaerobic regulatory protein